MALSKIERLKRKRSREEMQSTHKGWSRSIGRRKSQVWWTICQEKETFYNGSKKESKQSIAMRRRKWRAAKQRQLKRKKAAEVSSSTASTRSSSVRAKAKLRTENHGVKLHRQIVKLKNRNTEVDRKLIKYKRKYFCLLEKRNISWFANKRTEM